jgi:hypothetical protein
MNNHIRCHFSVHFFVLSQKSFCSAKSHEAVPINLPTDYLVAFLIKRAVNVRVRSPEIMEQKVESLLNSVKENRFSLPR